MNFLERTNTTRFILPLCGFSKEAVITNNFINAYLHLSDWPEKQGIFIAYRGKNKLLEELNCDFTKFTNTDITIYILRQEITPVMEMLIKGRYSKIPSAKKAQILDFWNLGSSSNLYFILYPDVFYNETGYGNVLAGRKPETWPPFKLDNETAKRPEATD